MLSTCVLTGGALPTWRRAWNTHSGEPGGSGGRSLCPRSPITNLNKELGAFDVNDERDGVVHRHAPRPVAFGDKRGEPSTSAVPHGQVDDQIKVVLLQVVHDAALLLLRRTPVVVLLKRPIDRLHLKPDSIYHFKGKR